MKYRKRPVVIEAVKWNGYNLDEIKKFTGNHADVKYDEKDGNINEDTKHLLGTTDMCPEEYINW